MKVSARYRRAIRNALLNNYSFAYIIRKNSESEEFFCDDSRSGKYSGGTCFMAVPWLSDFEHGYAIYPRISVDDLQGDTEETAVRESCTGFAEWKKEDYIASLRDLIAELGESGGKTVIARAIKVGTAVADICRVMDSYYSMNPDSYRCLFHTPETGCWLIASPELLMKVSGDRHFSTMALAGTRLFEGEDRMNRPWDEKNIAEQRLVTDYIVLTCGEAGMTLERKGPSTRHAGRVEHLCTELDGKIPKKTGFEKILNLLNPTPALCGSPKAVSCERIASIERHPREMYGGYFGVCNGADGCEFAVTLRCARIFSDCAIVYAGGGITAGSEPEKEWAETEAKSGSIISALKN